LDDYQFCKHKKEGHKTGPYVLWYPVRTEGLSEDGREGFKTPWGTRSSEYYRHNARLKKAGTYLQDKEHGQWVQWYSNGQMNEKREYDAGKKVGSWLGWFEGSRQGRDAGGDFRVDWSDAGGATLYCKPPYSGSDYRRAQRGSPASPFAEVSVAGEWTLLDLEHSTPKVRGAKRAKNRGPRAEESCAARVCEAGAFDNLFCEAEFGSLVFLEEFDLAEEFLTSLETLLGSESEKKDLMSARIEGGRLRAITKKRLSTLLKSQLRATKPEPWSGPKEATDLEMLRTSSERFEKYLGAEWVTETQRLIAQSVADHVEWSLGQLKTQPLNESFESGFVENVDFWKSHHLEYINAWAVRVDQLRGSSAPAGTGEVFQDWAVSALRAEVAIVVDSLTQTEEHLKLNAWLTAWKDYLGEGRSDSTLESLRARAAEVKEEVRDGLAGRPDAETLSGLAQQVRDWGHLLEEDWRLSTQKEVFKVAKGVVEAALTKGERRIRTSSQDAIEDLQGHSYDALTGLEAVNDLPEEAIDATWLKTAQQRAERLEMKWNEMSWELEDQEQAEEGAREKREEEQAQRRARAHSFNGCVADGCNSDTCATATQNGFCCIAWSCWTTCLETAGHWGNCFEMRKEKSIDQCRQEADACRETCGQKKVGRGNWECVTAHDD